MPTFVTNLEDLTNVYVDCLEKTLFRLSAAMVGNESGVTPNDAFNTISFLDETVYVGQPNMVEFLDAKHNEEYVEKVTTSAFAKTALEHIVDDKSENPLIRFMACALITTNRPDTAHQTLQTSKLLACVERLRDNKNWQNNMGLMYHFTSFLKQVDYIRAGFTQTPRQTVLGKAANKILEMTR